MHELKVEDGRVVFKDDGLSGFWHDYFADRWNSKTHVLDSVFLDVISKISSNVDNETLI